MHVPDQLTQATDLDPYGRRYEGQTRTRTASSGSSVIDPRIDGNAGSFTLDPDGGCR